MCGSRSNTGFYTGGNPIFIRFSAYTTSGQYLYAIKPVSVIRNYWSLNDPSTKDALISEVKLEVFPNPTGSGKVSIQYDVIKSGEYTMELYNSNGIIIQQIFKNKLMEIGQHSIEVPSDNSEGLHYVVLKGQDIIKRTPILIKN
jgi:hypothetical protein